MPDYQRMYYILFHASEQAIELLVEAQRKCEELYVNTPRENLSVFPASSAEKTDPNQ